MSSDDLLLIQLLVMAAGFLVVGVFVLAAGAAQGRYRRRSMDRVREEASSRGIELAASSSPGELRCAITIRTVLVAIDVVTSIEDRRRQQTRGVARALTPCRWADAALLREVPMMFGMGTLSEVRFEPWFPLRVFAADVGEVGTWLTPSVRASIAQMGAVTMVAVQGGQLTVTTRDPVASAHDALQLADLVASMHEARPTSVTARRFAGNRILLHWSLLAVIAALFCAAPFALFAPFSEPMLDGFSGLVCADGRDAYLIRSTPRPGRTTYTMACTSKRQGTATPSRLAFPTLAAIAGSAVFLAVFPFAAIGFFVRARRAENVAEADAGS